jgi:hypothetical protein
MRGEREKGEEGNWRDSKTYSYNKGVLRGRIWKTCSCNGTNP